MDPDNENSIADYESALSEALEDVGDDEEEDNEDDK